MLAPGTVVAGYRIEGLLGRGGMGAVYEATQLSLDRRVALKLISGDHGADAAFRARFVREARTQAALEHPSVVAVHEAGESAHGLFIAMRLIRGRTLRDELAERLIPLDRIVALLGPIADALDAAHAAGLVHRDVKPANVLLADDGRTLLADFGLSKPAAGGASITDTGEVLGTPHYVAPEVIRGEPASARSDVYGFAAMAYECVTGRVPFPHDNAHAVIYAHLHEPRPRPSDLRPELPRALDAVLARGMAVAPEDRYAGAGELVGAMAAAFALDPEAGEDGTDATGRVAAGVRIGLLGRVELTVGDRLLPLGPAKQRAMLAVLALQPNSPVSVDSLVHGLWGDDLPPGAPKLVEAYAGQLQRLLEGTDAEVVAQGRGYELRVAPAAVDAIRFERLLDDGAAGEALALWRGAPLADVADEPFAAAEIRRLQELRVRAEEVAIDGELAAGRHGEVLARLDRLLADWPVREGLHARRMLALYRLGRHADALEAYRQARQRLLEEVGLEPGRELRALHDRMLRQDAGLALWSDPGP